MPILTFKQVENLSPFRQALFIFLTTLAFLLSASYWSSNPEMHWIVATTGMCFFLWLNTFIFFFIRKKQLQYFLLSVLFFAAISAVLAYLAQYFSGLLLSKLYVYRALMAAIAIFYFVATAITFATKSLMQAFGVEEH